MLELPLHHCYLIQSTSVNDCVEDITQELREMKSMEDAELIFDTDIVETLTIEMAREMRGRGQYKAAGNAYCIIRGFDIATTEAQNALLKIIESPPEGVHFFLVTPQPGELLETIQSRSLYLKGACENSVAGDGNQLAIDFIKASTLKDRLDIVAKVQTKSQLREMLQLLADSDLPRKNKDFGNALELVADWGRDSGASLKLLGQYLAISSNDSHE